MKELKFSLNVNEANMILRALGNLPYIQVHELMQKIQVQAQAQLQNGGLGEMANPAEKDLTNKQRTDHN